jgi:hypothetical protein
MSLLCQSILTAYKMPGKILTFPSITFIIWFFAIFNGLFYILVSSLGTIYQEVYKFTASTAGFPYISISVGSILSLVFSVKLTKQLSGQFRKSDSEKEHKVYLLMVLLAALLSCVTWPSFGWACEKRIHWGLSLVSLFVYGFAGTAFRVAIFFAKLK